MGCCADEGVVDNDISERNDDVNTGEDEAKEIFLGERFVALVGDMRLKSSSS